MTQSSDQTQTWPLKIEMPKCIFDVPSVTYPESGSVPFSADGMAFETVSGGDEITVSYL